MTPADRYRVKAAELAAKAKSESSQDLQTDYATMSASYLRLAEQAERNATTDVVYETPKDSAP